MKTLFTRILTALLLAGFATGAMAEIVIGGKNFTEQLILSSMTGQYLSAHGFETDIRSGMGSTVLRKAQINGQVDLYWEYVGTSLIVYNDIKKELSPEESYQTVKELDAKKGLVWLEPSDANNTYALAMQDKQAEKLGIETLSDLAAAEKGDHDFVYALNAEFYARSDGWRPLLKAYGFSVPRPQVKRMDSGLTYQALKQGAVDVALVFATDGRIPAFNFRVLEDDKKFFPSYAITPVVRKETLEKHPKLRDLLNKLAATLSDDTMANLNAKVDVDGTSVKQVAHDYLVKHALI